MRIERAPDDIPSDEPFALEARDRWNLEAALFKQRRAGCTREQAVALLAGSPALPHGEWGLRLADACWARVDKFANAIEAEREGERREPLPVNLALDGLRLVGRLERNDAAGVLAYALKKIGWGDLMGAWIEHLALCAMAPEAAPRSRLLTIGGYHEFAPVAEPRAVLQDLFAIYQRGQTQPVPLFPKCSIAWLRATKRDRAMQAAREAWAGDPPHVDGECTDVWLEAVYGDDCEILPDEFEAALACVLGALTEHLRSGRAQGAAA